MLSADTRALHLQSTGAYINKRKKETSLFSGVSFFAVTRVKPDVIRLCKTGDFRKRCTLYALMCCSYSGDNNSCDTDGTKVAIGGGDDWRNDHESGTF